MAVLLDATIARMILVPATMELLGDRNRWLPRWLDRLLPRRRPAGRPTGVSRLCRSGATGVAGLGALEAVVVAAVVLPVALLGATVVGVGMECGRPGTRRPACRSRERCSGGRGSR